MIRFWIEFDLKNYSAPPMGVILGCGVTASSLEEAEKLLKEKIFKQNGIPPILKCISNVDVSTLDKNHVLPNMGSPIDKGVWFPLGYG